MRRGRGHGRRCGRGVEARRWRRRVRRRARELGGTAAHGVPPTRRARQPRARSAAAAAAGPGAGGTWACASYLDDPRRSVNGAHRAQGSRGPRYAAGHAAPRRIASSFPSRVERVDVRDSPPSERSPAKTCGTVFCPVCLDEPDRAARPSPRRRPPRRRRPSCRGGASRGRRTGSSASCRGSPSARAWPCNGSVTRARGASAAEAGSNGASRTRRMPVYARGPKIASRAVSATRDHRGVAQPPLDRDRVEGLAHVLDAPDHLHPVLRRGSRPRARAARRTRPSPRAPNAFMSALSSNSPATRGLDPGGVEPRLERAPERGALRRQQDRAPRARDRGKPFFRCGVPRGARRRWSRSRRAGG